MNTDPMMERDGTSAALADIRAERVRQMHAEGWTPEHDDTHSNGQMAMAAACYALHSRLDPLVKEIIATDPPSDGDVVFLRRYWPWSREWWKPKDSRRDLVRAAALIVAEIERLDRKSIG